MPSVRLGETCVDLLPGETVLDGLAREGTRIPSSCRAGVCQSCLLTALEGTPPQNSQAGLRDTWKHQGCFLACTCVPTEDMVVALPGEALRQRLTATVESKVLLNRDILRLQLSVPKPLEYEAGQYIQLERADGLTRSYSLASLPSEPLLELHVRRLPDGAMSRWLADEIQPGSTVTIAGPSGSMFYAPGMPQQPLLMVATGSGLAPLWGIVRTALLQGHTGPIRLYHGSWSTEGLYLREELKALSQQHSSFTYIPCADETTDPCVRRERADAAALSDVPNSAGWRVFLCGHPEMVNSLRRKIFLAGAAFRDILADPFVNAAR